MNYFSDGAVVSYSKHLPCPEKYKSGGVRLEERTWKQMAMRLVRPDQSYSLDSEHPMNVSLQSVPEHHPVETKFLSLQWNL